GRRLFWTRLLSGCMGCGDDAVMSAARVVSTVRARDEVVDGRMTTVDNLTTTSSREAQPRSSLPHHHSAKLSLNATWRNVLLAGLRPNHPPRRARRNGCGWR